MEATEFSKAAKEEFLNLASGIDRDGIKTLLDHMQANDFFVCPASTRFHGNYPGGLCKHSLNVFYNLVIVNRAFHLGLSDDSMRVAALFHDICKMNCYKEAMKWRKDENNQWEQYTTYVFDEDLPYGGHGSKSVFILQNFIKLNVDEAVAINCHMGFSDRMPGDFSLGKAYERYPLAWALHVADEAATYIDEVEHK